MAEKMLTKSSTFSPHCVTARQGRRTQKRWAAVTLVIYGDSSTRFSATLWGFSSLRDD